MRSKYANIINPTPREWDITNKSQAQKAAEKAQKKLNGKKLVQIDSNTWVYVGPGEDAKPVQRYNYMD